MDTIAATTIIHIELVSGIGLPSDLLDACMLANWLHCLQAQIDVESTSNGGRQINPISLREEQMKLG